MPSEKFDDLLREQLRDPDIAAAYVSAALEDGGMSRFLRALRQVADAKGGLGELSDEIGVNRQHLYRLLAEDGNPHLANILDILRGLELRIAFLSAGESKTQRR